MVSTGVQRLKVWLRLGKKVSSLLRVCISKICSTGDWEFENSALMGILKLNSAGDMHFKASTMLRIWMMYCRGFPLEELKDILVYFQPINNCSFSFRFICKQWLYLNAYAYLTNHWTFSNKTSVKRMERQENYRILKYICINFCEYFCTKETDILVR